MITPATWTTPHLPEEVGVQAVVPESPADTTDVVFLVGHRCNEWFDETHIARAVGKQERIAVKAVRQRLRSYPIAGGAMRGKLWFGINPLEASRSGRPRQTKAGVSVGSRRYRGAFYKKVYGNQADIWIRTASKHFVRADYPDSEVTSQTGASSGFVGENSDRFPLAKAKISLDSVRPHFEAWSRKADERLLQILRQEMNFELQKYLKGARRV